MFHNKGPSIMSKKRVLYFFASIVLLIISEYLLLNQLMVEGHAAVLVGSAAGLLASIYYIIRFYNEWRNSLK